MVNYFVPASLMSRISEVTIATFTLSGISLGSWCLRSTIDSRA